MFGYLLFLVAIVAVVASLAIWGSFCLCQNQGRNSLSPSSSRTPRRQLPTRPTTPRYQPEFNELTERLQERADHMAKGGTPKSRRSSH